ncbi:MAG: small subunit ribosomal protein S2 [Candidatus Berkelbacteria bacterium Licking1014_7]|uniref:Small ribosomal subunit protein uS2 n=1 Tax=Candidatus Berkelbacteria bacterium Licking1014_7 TaxID=2017147 RepID=A0A554LI34_9BACT|nr:MAG: small subunit ribosomal protein S2 [Candidatus Berkelbacteria bacterium Licking1014_7]
MDIKESKSQIFKMPTLEELFRAGAHFGHSKQKAHTKANKFVWGVQKGVNIINLEKTQKYLKKALEYIQVQIDTGNNFLIVATKKHFSSAVADFAKNMNMPFVNHKWLGGTLTNFDTIKKSIKKFVNLEKTRESEKFQSLSKKERAKFEKDLAKMRRNFDGIRNLNSLPQNLFVIDAREEQTALKEAKMLGIPVIAITDTNYNPEKIDFPIPANDDVLASVQIILDAIKENIKDKKQDDASKSKTDSKN